MKKQQKKTVYNRLYTSILLVLLALVAVTAATVAWFSIADKTRVRTMSLDIITDVEMRMDLDSHATIDDYVKTLTFDQIAERMQIEKGFSMSDTPLKPVTTSDCDIFTYENGSVVESTSGSYLEFTLHFMAARDMIVHLTSANSSEKASDGTAVLSENPELPLAMRISFTADEQNWIYDPGEGNEASPSGNIIYFGLPDAASMELSDNNAMFSLKEGEDKAVVVHIWLEGTDPACTDALRASDYAIRLRFTGTDME
ncbi:MAG: hypothetical protein Q4E78_05635 [Eubacteriales bacterium]|nr:hypothetical protein [Eubacteriales bacterium]